MSSTFTDLFRLLVVILCLVPATQSLGQCPCDGLPPDACAVSECGDSPIDCEDADVCPWDSVCSHSCCCNCLHCRDHLFGDWLGMRSGLASHGIVVELPFTQFYQGVTSGGVQRTGKYGGKQDYMFTLLGEPLGLNKGFRAMIHAETRYGEDINRAAGVLAFPNTNMLYPLPGENETAVTGFLLMQALNEKIALVGGKFNGLDLFNMLYPNTGRGIDGFMNTNFLLPPTLFRTTGLSFNGAGVMAMQGEQIQSAFLAYDANSTSTTVAPDLFGKGAVFLGYHRFFTEFGGLSGSHGFLGNYSTRTYASTDPLNWAMIPGQGLAAIEKEGSWTLAYFLDQMLWVDCCDENRNVRLFSTWSLADGDPNPYRWSGNVQLQGTGLIAGREADTMGAGYFYAGLSSEFKTLVSAAPGLDIEDIHGFELYYNAAITPWFHLTGDLQIVDNQNVGDATSIILGLRAKIDL